MSLGNRFSYPETDEQVIPIRQPKTSLLLLDSNDRFTLTRSGVYAGSSQNGNYNNYTINSQKLSGFGQIKRIGVSEVLFPWITPNVNPYTNLLVIAGGVENPYNAYYIKMTEGFYTAQSIADPVPGTPGTGPLSTQLNTNLKYVSTNGTAPFGAGFWTTTYNPSNGSITISNSAVQFAITTVPVGLGNLNGSTGLDTLLSYDPYVFEDLVEGNLSNSYTGGRALMTYTQYIDVCSNALCKFQKLRDSLTQFSYSNIICRIYLASPTNMSSAPFGVAPVPSFFTQYQNIKWMEWNSNQMIGEIDIQYYDDAGNPLYIPSLPNSTIPSVNQIFTMIMSDS